ncbi:uncharacterized protein LOC116621517 [Nematostella vectensis]|uniref:uncharacterized protein LOC116621517 n=1 Tax=Nematostella vectensis TaxID=45351 RepID=UPI002077030F|nr:uncharacterized protein LOC116621517 [Nematostella vectensis]XP_048588122.1 uncharacterized protein LOC116621517 [Nematostella vectensis]
MSNGSPHVIWLLWLLGVTARMVSGYEFNVFRGEHGKAQDWFQAPRELCERAGSSWRCSDFGALASPTACYKCTCPIDKATFGFHGGKWRCIGNSDLRQQTGCNFLFAYQSQTSPVKIVKSRVSYRLDLPNDRPCEYTYSRDTSIRACNGTWSGASSVRPSPRYRYKSYERQTYYHALGVDNTGAAPLESRLIRIDIKCTKPGAPPIKSCLLLKERYVSYPEKCVVTDPTTAIPSSPTTSSSIDQFATIEPTLKLHPGPTVTQATQPAHIPLATDQSPTPYKTQGDQAGFGSPLAMIAITAASGGGGLVLVIFILCLVFWRRRRKRRGGVKYSSSLYNNSEHEECDDSQARIYETANGPSVKACKTDTMMSHSNPGYGRGKDLSIKISSPGHVIPTAPRLNDLPGFIKQTTLTSDNSMFVDMRPEVLYENIKNLVPQESPNMQSEPSQSTEEPFYAVLEGPVSESIHGVCNPASQEITIQKDSNDNDDVIYANSPVVTPTEPACGQHGNPTEPPFDQRYIIQNLGSKKVSDILAAEERRRANINTEDDCKRLSSLNCGYDLEESKSDEKGSSGTGMEECHYASLQGHNTSGSQKPSDDTYQSLDTPRPSEYQSLTLPTSRQSVKPSVRPKPSIKPKPSVKLSTDS